MSKFNPRLILLCAFNYVPPPIRGVSKVMLLAPSSDIGSHSQGQGLVHLWFAFLILNLLLAADPWLHFVILPEYLIFFLLQILHDISFGYRSPFVT
jgi:hypothetical protein